MYTHRHKQTNKQTNAEFQSHLKETLLTYKKRKVLVSISLERLEYEKEKEHIVETHPLTYTYIEIHHHTLVNK